MKTPLPSAIEEGFPHTVSMVDGRGAAAGVGTRGTTPAGGGVISPLGAGIAAEDKGVGTGGPKPIGAGDEGTTGVGIVEAADGITGIDGTRGTEPAGGGAPRPPGAEVAEGVNVEPGNTKLVDAGGAGSAGAEVDVFFTILKNRTLLARIESRLVSSGFGLTLRAPSNRL